MKKIYFIIGMSFTVIAVSLYFTFRPQVISLSQALMPARIELSSPTTSTLVIDTERQHFRLNQHYHPMNPAQTHMVNQQLAEFDHFLASCDPVTTLSNRRSLLMTLNIENDKRIMTYQITQSEQTHFWLATTNQVKNTILRSPRARHYQCQNAQALTQAFQQLPQSLATVP